MAYNEGANRNKIGFHVSQPGNHSVDMGTWNYHCDLESDCISLTAWDGVGLVVSEKGAAARLLVVPFAT